MSRQAIKNYTTEVSAAKSAAEILELLAAAGARRIQQEFSDRRALEAIGFSLAISGREFFYRLAPDCGGVLRALQRSAPPRYRTAEQARRVAWRIERDWLDAQLAKVEAGIAQAAEVFLPWMIVGEGGRTVFAEFAERELKQLPAPAGEGG